MRSLMFLIAWLSLWASPVWAHSLDVFAYAEGSRIVGSVHLTSGTVPQGASVRISGPEGEVVAKPAVGEDGSFRYQAERAVDHRIVARTSDGHEAEWTVPASELAGTDGSKREDSGTASQAADGEIVTLSRDELDAIVERAVAREVGPLREELRGYANRVRLGDIVGGLGGIIGLAGAAMWWRARRREGA